jgi:hypothetical protein
MVRRTLQFPYRCRCRRRLFNIAHHPAAAPIEGLVAPRSAYITERAEFPDRMAPHGLQLGCKERHPEWSKTKKSGACISYTSVRKPRRKPKPPAVEQPDDEPEVTLSAGTGLGEVEGELNNGPGSGRKRLNQPNP